MSQKTLRLVSSGILIGMAVVMSMIKVFELPYGGSITLFSMVPIFIIGYKYGWCWGLICGTVDGILQAVLGATMSNAYWGVSGIDVLWMTVLDYFAAFAVLGLAGLFKKMNNKTLSISLGVIVAGFLRFLCHFISGYILWGSYAESFFSSMSNSFGDYVLGNFTGKGLALLYSAVYNGSFMIPEILISVIAVVALMAIKPVSKEIIS